jgi:CRP-like cAMP-binding protein
MSNSDPMAKLLAKLRLRDRVSEHEAGVLRKAVACVAHHPAGHVLVEEGKPLNFSILLTDGVVARYKDLAEGQRQITELHVPGDFVDLHGYLLKRLEHSVGALTPVTVAMVPHKALTAITETEPHLTRMLWLTTQIDAAIQRERILSLGRRTAVARIAHILCELFHRLRAVELTGGTRFDLPITQADLADATGLTGVHVNRMLRELRSKKLVTFRSGVVDIHDLEGLEQCAEFDPAYLFMTDTPR